MKNPTIVRSGLRPWFASFAFVLGAMLVELTFMTPAHSADLGFPGYGPGYYGGSGPTYYGGYAQPSYGCGDHCGCVSHCGCGWSCLSPYGGNVVERHYVERSYHERRYVSCCGGYGPYGYGYGGSYPSADVPPSPIPYGNGYGYGY